METNGNGKIKQEHRTTVLETKVETILTNHLPHIQAAVDSLKSKIDKITMLLITTLVTVIITFIKSFL